jgi:hypothetical protein
VTVIACTAIICGSALLGWRWYLAAWPPLKALRAEMDELKKIVRPILLKHGLGG